MEKYQLDALVTPTQGPPWAIDLVNGDHHLGSTSSTPAALAGYPIVVPAGYTRATSRHQLPWATVQRANSDPAGVRVRAGGMRPSASALPPYAH
jgi:amidase